MPLPSPSADPRSHRLTVPPELHGARLDRALAASLPALSRTRLKALIQAGCVRVAGAEERRPAAALEAGAEIVVEERALAPPREEALLPPLEVLYEDEHIAVVDKPAGMLVHAGAGHSPGARGPRGATVSDVAVARYGPLPALQGSDRPGIVHRLDAGTSGVLVLARTEAAFAGLMRQFHGRQVEKTYAALVWGEPRFDSGWIEAPIARAGDDSGRMTTAAPGEGRESETYYEVRERFRGAARLDVRPRTGRTHQIRVHLASIGHPLLGDVLYRKRGTHPGRLPEGAPRIARQALHAARIAFVHPLSGERMELEAPLPADLAALLAWLRGRAGDPVL